MEITEIKIFKATKKGPVVAFANIVLDNSFIIRGIRLLEKGKNIRFISMPARRLKGEEKSYRDLCHPLNTETRNKLTAEIFEAYDNFIKEMH